MSANGQGYRGEKANLEHNSGCDADSNLDDEHEQQGDNEAADGSLAALAHAVYDDDACQEPHNPDENKEAL